MAFLGRPVHDGAQLEGGPLAFIGRPGKAILRVLIGRPGKAILLVFIIAMASVAAAAPPEAKYFYPAGAARGASADVTAAGNFADWPASAWVNRPGITIMPAADKGKLSVSVAEDAVPGIYWVRLYTAAGSAAPLPFIVGTLPEVNEQEPNDFPAKAQALPSSIGTINGRLEKRGDVDTFAVSLTKGQTLVAAVTAHETLGSPMDSVLQIVSPRGSVLEQNDDERGLDSVLAFTAPADGVYLARIFAFPAAPDASVSFAGGETFVYRLTLTTGGFLDGALPLAVSRTQPTELTAYGWGLMEPDAKRTIAPQSDATTFDLFAPQWAGAMSLPVVEYRSLVEAEPNDAAQPQAIEGPLAISGQIGEPRDLDAFRFHLAKGQAWQFNVESRRLGYPLDAVLELFDAMGKSIARADDAGQQPDAELSFTAPADGDFTLVVSDLYGDGGPRFFYRLSLAPQEPDFALTVAEHAYVFMPDKPLEIPVTIDRRHGFAGEIDVQVDGLPPGVTAAAVKSLASGDMAKSVKVVLSGTSPAFSGPIHITGVSSPPVSRSHRAEAKLPAAAHLSDLWLTVANK